MELGALGARLRGGGDVFHRACAVLSFVCVGSRRCRAHAMDQLKLRGSGMSRELGFVRSTFVAIVEPRINSCINFVFRIFVAVIKTGLKEFSMLLGEGSQKSQIEHYIAEI